MLRIAKYTRILFFLAQLRVAREQLNKIETESTKAKADANEMAIENEVYHPPLI